MIFEKGWFLRKMSKYAPKGFKFVACGKDGRIALYSKEIMGKQEPAAPFISCFSFDMLDMLYGGLMVRSYERINQASPAAAYMDMPEITKRPMFAPDQQTWENMEASYNVYRSIVERYKTMYGKPHALFMYNNALVLQGLQESGKIFPKLLSDRQYDYVNKCVWYAICRVFASMPICDLKRYQELYRQKSAEMGIEYGKQSDIVDFYKEIERRRIQDIKREIDCLMYDVLPKQQKALETKIQKNPENTVQIKRQEQLIKKTNAEIARLNAEKLRIKGSKQASNASQMLRGQMSVPENISNNPVGLMFQLMLLRKHQVKSK